MSTRAKIKIMNADKTLCALYIPMDGHVENWASDLVAALRRTRVDDILHTSALLQFLLADTQDDAYLDYLCRVDLADGTYQISLLGYGDKPLFAGGLDAFADRYAGAGA
jgi:hypothetical protein